MELKGQVTISIEDFEKLKATAEQKEYAENRLTAFKDRMSQFYEIEDTEFWKQVEEIDSKPMTDRQTDCHGTIEGKRNIEDCCRYGSTEKDDQVKDK